MFGSRSKREHPVRNASNWGKINFFITGDKFTYFPGHAVFCAKLIFGYIWPCRNVMEFEWMDCFSPFALRKASWQSKLITLTSEESGSASNSSTLDLFSLSLFHRYGRSHFVDTLEISGNCYAIDRVSKHRGPVMSHAIFSVVDR